MEKTTTTQKRRINRNHQGIFGLVSQIKNKLAISSPDSEDFMKQLKDAHDDWERAEIYFDNVTDPDLVDYSIFRMEAAKKKYAYMLKMAREDSMKFQG